MRQAAGRTVAEWHQEQFFALTLPVRHLRLRELAVKAGISFVGLIAINRCLIMPIKGC
jgi:hypothetical protein